MSDNGHVYRCNWKKIPDGDYLGWVEKRPSLRTDAGNPDDLIDSLTDLIVDHYNDHEPCLEFHPPLKSPAALPSYFSDRLISISWNSHFQIAPPEDILFSQGVCSDCRYAKGTRTAETLHIKSLWPGSDGLFSGGTPAHIYILSEAFLRLLTPRERAQFKTRPVSLPPKKNRKLFEVLPKKFIPTVAIKDIPTSGWQCKTCRNSHYSQPQLGLCVYAISRKDLPSAPPPLFFIGAPHHFHLCLSHNRFEKLRQESATRQILHNPLAVVSESLAIRNPSLPTKEQLFAFRAKHGPKLPYTAIPRAHTHSRK